MNCLRISDYIAITGIVVGIIGIIVGIIGSRCLYVANKNKNVAEGNMNSPIHQAGGDINIGLSSVEVVELSQKTAKSEIDNLPLPFVSIIKPDDWVNEEGGRNFDISANNHNMGQHPKVNIFAEKNGDWNIVGCGISMNNNGDVRVGIGRGFEVGETKVVISK